MTEIKHNHSTLLQSDKTPLVSVLMSVYNDEEYLSESIESILRQTFTDFEFVIINDGSTDGSGDIIDNFASKDSRIQVFHQENSGLTTSLNRGLEICRGEYIARQDGDDISHPSRLYEQMDYFKQHPNTVLLGTNAETIDSQGAPLMKEDISFIEGNRHLQNTLLCFNPFIHSSVIFKKDLALKVGGYCNQDIAAEDYGLWLRISQTGLIENLSLPLVQRRLTMGMISINNIKQARRTTIRLRLKHFRFALSASACWYLVKDLSILLLPLWFIKHYKQRQQQFPKATSA